MLIETMNVCLNLQAAKRYNESDLLLGNPWALVNWSQPCADWASTGRLHAVCAVLALALYFWAT